MYNAKKPYIFCSLNEKVFVLTDISQVPDPEVQKSSGQTGIMKDISLYMVTMV